MGKRIIYILLLAILPIAAQAYQGDYVWEEKFKKRLPEATAGNIEAQYDVGEMYERGRGVAKDAQKAFEWYMKAAAQGSKKGAYRVGLSYLKGTGVKKKPDEAFNWMQMAANKGYERALYYLGVMYEKGEGVEQNYTKALSNYKKALSGGYAAANDRIADVKKAIRKEERLRTKRIEAEARRLVAKQKRAKARKVSRNPSLTTKELLLKGGWNKKNKPAEFLPSKVANCKATGPNIECLSSGHKRNIGMADIVYTTKAILYSIKDDGSFKVSYRNNVTDIKITDPDFSSTGRKVPVRKGWQDAEHKLVCNIEKNNLMNCTKDKIRSVTFNRK